MKMNIFNVTKQTELPVNIVKVCRYCLDICRYCVDIVNVFSHIREVHDLPPSEHIFYDLPIIKSCVDDNTYFNLHKKMCFYNPHNTHMTGLLHESVSHTQERRQ